MTARILTAIIALILLFVNGFVLGRETSSCVEVVTAEEMLRIIELERK